MPVPLRNLVTRRVGPLLILCHGREEPRNEEWDEVLELLRKMKKEAVSIRVLVITPGPAPTPVQRKKLAAVLEGDGVPVAVVSESVKARFISAAIALINRDNRAFAPSEIMEAYNHLRLSATERMQAEAAVKLMRQEVY